MRLARDKIKFVPTTFVVVAICLQFLCSCATKNSNPNRLQLPADVKMNGDAGRGNWLIVTVQLPDGEKLPMVVDTGTSDTILDKSLEPKLGKQLETVMIQQWGKHEIKNVYAMPKLYLGKALLKVADNRIVTDDCQPMSNRQGHPVMGILGMDILQYYCIQLDFAAGKIRFLDDEKADTKNWGKAFPIVPLNDSDPRPAVAQNLFGVQGANSLIDSGYLGDGWLMPKYFQQWTNSAVTLTNGEVHSPFGKFDGEEYPEVSLDVNDVESDGIGIDFLARHLVTLDFPKHTLYLKRTSDFRLVGRDKESVLRAEAESAMKYLKQLHEQNRLPGSSSNDHGKADFHYEHRDSPYLDSLTVDVQKNDDSTICHYIVTRISKNGSWKLQKAWRTDADGKTLEEYPVP